MSEKILKNKQQFYFGLLLLSVPLFFFWHLLSGPTDISIISATKDLLNGNASTDALIFSEIRLPRALLAICIGISLALSGAALQGLLINPLASPDLLGVSQSGVFAAVLVLYYGLATLSWIIVPLAAMSGALIAAAFIFSLAGKYQATLTIILIGIAINAITSAMTSLALSFAPNPFALQEIYFWMLGSLSNRSSNELFFALPFMLLGWTLILPRKHFLDAMSLGEDTAISLGFNLKKQKLLLILGVALCTGASVAVSGNISFIGLMVPHLLRPLVNNEPGRLLAYSAVGGASLLLLADTLVQNIAGPQELQVGVITAALGGPFFLFLIFKNRHLMR
ncbi:MAG: ABC transporter permease [SAR86 cluster bacterium]|uniref:ABC transporter permease n=1 Tax=SAR86 cluster bacterium TaxID=2030880 RepID=A0A2A5CK09_9GAMM|nr:MAG: ABC transporter permease [SAR86 cluster bacterium]